MKKTLLFVLACALALTAWAEPQRLAFILDASDSMNIALDGSTRFGWAKEALTLVLGELSPETSFAITVFGHRIPKTQEPATCRDIELLASFGTHGPADRSVLVAAIGGLTAMGKTPLAESLRFTAARVPPPARIVLLTDGGETCGGDPVGEARRLCALGYTVDVVALSVTPADEKNLRALAAAGCGQFIVVAQPRDLPPLFRGFVVPTPPTPAPTVPDCLAKYRVDPSVVALLLKHLPYAPCTDPMWDVILGFLEENPPAKVLVGTDGDDVLFGTPGNDLILGLGGDDQLFGFAGNDLLIGGSGNDLIQAGDGDDLVLGGPGNDLLFGGSGDDVIYGEDGDDRIEGEAGSDKLFGGSCNDIILGGPGCNVIDGGPGKNFVYDEGTCAPRPPTPACAPPCTPPAPTKPTTPPTSHVAPGIKTVVEGGTIVLRATVEDPDGDPVTVTWSAAKGMFSDPHALETTYCAPWVKACEGELVEITLTAVDACGAVAVDKLVLHVLNANHPPAADAGPDLAVDEGGQVKLLASALDPDGDALSFFWTIPSGRGTLDNPRALQPIYTAPLTSRCEGEAVELVLTVTDACGAVARDTVRVHVRNLNRAPWADAGPDLQVPEKAQIMILGKAGDPDGERLLVSWWASAGTLSGADTLCPVFVAPEVEGCDYILVTVTLCVVDPCGAVAQDSLVIKVLNVNRPPRVTADP